MVNEGTLGNRVAEAREARERTDGLSRSDIEELKRLPAETPSCSARRLALVVLHVAAPHADAERAAA